MVVVKTFLLQHRVNILSGGKYWSCNLAAIWGQMATGGGFNHLQESMSVLGIPVMSKQSFVTTEQAIGKCWWDLFNESMQAAGKAEQELAIQQNSYHQGVPAITMLYGASEHTNIHIMHSLQ